MYTKGYMLQENIWYTKKKKKGGNFTPILNENQNIDTKEYEKKNKNNKLLLNHLSHMKIP